MASTQRRVITRNRELLACSECRRRKLKCDRHTPCATCVKRGDEPSCKYQRSANGSEHERGRRSQAEARLEHLERLVHEFAQNGDGSVTPGQTKSLRVADQPVGREKSRAGCEASKSNGFVYNGSTHWSAMLEDIEGLRSAIAPDEATASNDDESELEENIASNLILGSAAPLPLQQVLAQYLPLRHEADSLVAAYFRSGGVSVPFIHASCFRRQYQAFWNDPLQAPVLWTSILFSICYIAKNTLILRKDDEHPENKYNIASAHCLAVGEYFRPKQFAVESLLLFAQSKCVTGPAISPEIGLIFGLLVRLATTMGYHRDPELFRLSVFEKEMRRRTWSICMQLDLLVSFQLGLPSNIQYPTWDTSAPRNLYDSELDENTGELPLARPDSESTNIMFYIAKHRLMTVFEKILRHNLATGTDGTTDMDRLDGEIRLVYSVLPNTLRPRLIADSFVDSPSLIVARLCVFFLYQKCLCVLHRPYVIRGQVHSIQICHEAASNIVLYFLDSYKEFLPGGQMEAERWFMGSITWHDYLLGVMALCLALCASSHSMTKAHVKSHETLQLLQQARDVCVEQSTRSKDSGRVQKVADATLLYFGSLERQSIGDAMAKPSSSTTSFDLSLTQSKSFGDQTYGLDNMGLHGLQGFAPEQTETVWTESDPTTRPLDDVSWAYLGQFLNLSSGDLMQSM